MKADLHTFNNVELSWMGQMKKSPERTSWRHSKGEFFEGGNVPKNLEAYYSLDLEARSTKFTATMATQRMNIAAKLSEASSNG